LESSSKGPGSIEQLELPGTVLADRKGCSVLGGSHTCDASKDSAKMTLVRKTGRRSNLGKRRTAFPNFTAGIFNAKAANIVSGSAGVVLAEFAGQVNHMNSDRLRHRDKIQMLRKMSAQEFFCLAKHSEAGCDP